MKISTKFFLPAGIFSAVVITIFIVLALAFKTQTDSLQAFYTSHISMEKEVFGWQKQMTEAHAVAAELIIGNMMGESPQAMRETAGEARQTLEKVRAELQALHDKSGKAGQKQVLAALRDGFAGYLPVFDEVIGLCISADAYSASEKYPQLKQQGRELKSAFHQLLLLEAQFTEHAIRAAVEQTSATARQAENSAWLIAVTLFLFVASLAVLISRWIITPLKKAADFATAIAGGDFTARLSLPQKDELGTLVTELSVMGAHLNNLLRRIQQSGVQLSSSANELASTTRRQETVMDSQLAAVDDVLHAIEEISALSTALVETMARITLMAQETAQAAGTGQSKLTNMKNAIRHMEEASESISARLATIHEKAESISSVVTTITKVADQTNLLSLNAAIEAEKAGEYGRGFMVVANEIRRLADQTAVATLDIENMVSAMHQAVSSGVMEIDKFIRQVHGNAEEIQAISTQLNLIIDGVQALTPNFESVNLTVRKQSDNAEEINRRMGNLNREVQDSSESFSETHMAIEQLKETALALQAEVSRLKVSH